MPGIFAIFSRSKPPRECQSDAHAMLASMMHEPFYVSGTFSMPDLGVYCGWVAQESSFAASVSGFHEETGVALIFAGECFPTILMLRKSRIRTRLRRPEVGTGSCVSGARRTVHRIPKWPLQWTSDRSQSPLRLYFQRPVRISGSTTTRQRLPHTSQAKPRHCSVSSPNCKPLTKKESRNFSPLDAHWSGRPFSAESACFRRLLLVLQTQFRMAERTVLRP